MPRGRRRHGLRLIQRRAEKGERPPRQAAADGERLPRQSAADGERLTLRGLRRGEQRLLPLPVHLLEGGRRGLLEELDGDAAVGAADGDVVERLEELLLGVAQPNDERLPVPAIGARLVAALAVLAARVTPTDGSRRGGSRRGGRGLIRPGRVLPHGRQVLGSAQRGLIGGGRGGRGGGRRGDLAGPLPRGGSLVDQIRLRVELALELGDLAEDGREAPRLVEALGVQHGRLRRVDNLDGALVEQLVPLVRLARPRGAHRLARRLLARPAHTLDLCEVDVALELARRLRVRVEAELRRQHDAEDGARLLTVVGEADEGVGRARLVRLQQEVAVEVVAHLGAVARVQLCHLVERQRAVGAEARRVGAVLDEKAHELQRAEARGVMERRQATSAQRAAGDAVDARLCEEELLRHVVLALTARALQCRHRAVRRLRVRLAHEQAAHARHVAPLRRVDELGGREPAFARLAHGELERLLEETGHLRRLRGERLWREPVRGRRGRIGAHIQQLPHAREMAGACRVMEWPHLVLIIGGHLEIRAGVQEQDEDVVVLVLGGLVQRNLRLVAGPRRVDIRGRWSSSYTSCSSPSFAASTSSSQLIVAASAPSVERPAMKPWVRNADDDSEEPDSSSASNGTVAFGATGVA